jgi:hypothetical protein
MTSQQQVPFMKRASHVAVPGGRGSLRGSVVGTTLRRDLLQMQAALDKGKFLCRCCCLLLML